MKLSRMLSYGLLDEASLVDLVEDRLTCTYHELVRGKRLDCVTLILIET